MIFRTITGTNQKTQPLLAQYFLLLLLNESEIQRKAIAHDPANTKHTVLCVEQRKNTPKLYKIRNDYGNRRKNRDTRREQRQSVRDEPTNKCAA